MVSAAIEGEAQMEPRANYTIVGAFVIFFMALLVLAIIWFSASQYKPHETYQVYMGEAVSGLTIQAPVKFNGVEVGYVDDIEVNPQNPKQVLLTLSIEKGTPIDQSTTATLKPQGITGVTYIGLQANTEHAPKIPILPGNKYPIITYQPSVLAELHNSMHEITAVFKQMRETIKTLFTSENSLAIHNTLMHLDKVTKNLSDNSTNISAGIKELTSTLQETKALAKTISQQAVPGTVQTLGHINKLLNDLQQVTDTLKNNPSALIRGQAPRPAGPGE